MKLVEVRQATIFFLLSVHVRFLLTHAFSSLPAHPVSRTELLHAHQQRRKHHSLSISLTVEDQSETQDGQSRILSRAIEIATVAAGLAVPLITSAVPTFIVDKIESNTPQISKDNDTTITPDLDVWDKFWKATANNEKVSNAERVVLALDTLGPTFVKFGQALASRPDIIPPSLAAELCSLQDDMIPFDTASAKAIIKEELIKSGIDPEAISTFIESLSEEPVAAASVGQVYKGYIPDIGSVAVKVQRPGIRTMVEKDAALLMNIANLVESIPSPLSFFERDGSLDKSAGIVPNKKTRLINTELVAGVDEFMSRIFEELDYTKESENAETFARLYCEKKGTAKSSLPNGEGVIVPEIIKEYCSQNIIVMTWIEGNKLTSLGDSTADTTRNSLPGNDDELKENLALIEKALYVTLSQLLDTGVMHADPHGGNLLKVNSTSSDASKSLAYLDFGLLATIPSQVRDGLVCAVAQLVFARDVEAVASLFGELDLLPAEVLSVPEERNALTSALSLTMDEVLEYPKVNGTALSTSIPSLRFDKLLDGLIRLVPRFQFRLPPYFINNARALGTLEGIARSLDPQFNCLQLMYPYALYRILQNPSGSTVITSTLQNLIRSKETGRLDRQKVSQLLRDSALFTGFSKRKIFLDIVKTKGGKILIAKSIGSELKHAIKTLLQSSSKNAIHDDNYFLKL